MFSILRKKYLKNITKVFQVGFVGLVLSASFFIPSVANALPELPSFLKPACTAEKCEFTFLAPINFPGFNIQGGKTDVGGSNGASAYLKGLYMFGIAIAGALALIMVVVGGVQYASTDAIGGKSAGKDRITAALTGLVLALLAYTILNTINVNLVKNNFSPKAVTVTPAGASGGGATGGAVEPVPGGGTGTGTGTGTGVTGAGEGLRNESWNIYAYEALRNSTLNGATPSDLAEFFPDGQATPENWLKLMSAMAQRESGFDPNQTYTETFKDRNGDFVISTGLFQVSQESSRGYGFPGITTQDLKDPYKNIDVTVAIMEKLISKGNCIACGREKGASEYWAVLNGDSLADIKKELNTPPKAK